MKKTLIALAVAATAAVSGSAMADWAPTLSSNSVTLGGTLTPESKDKSVWEVSAGAERLGLNAEIPEGVTAVDISIDSGIPVLGIRSVSGGFKGNAGSVGLIPNIKFNSGKINDVSFSQPESTATFSLNIMDDEGKDIGSLSAKLQSVGLAQNASDASSLNAHGPEYAFYGGLPRTATHTVKGADALTLAEKLFPGVLQNWNKNIDVKTAYTWQFGDENKIYNAAYAAGIPANSTIKINLTSPLKEETQWKAQLPVEVSFN